MKSATGLVLTCVIFTLVLFVPEKTAALEGDSTGQTFAVEQEKVRRKENLFFRNVSVKGKGGKYEVTGEARPATGQFFTRWRTDIINMLMKRKGRLKTNTLTGKTSKFPYPWTRKHCLRTGY